MIKKYKLFEAQKLGYASAVSSEEDLTTYYRCNNCGKLFSEFNETIKICDNCDSDDIALITDIEYFAILKRVDEVRFKIEYTEKKKRESNLVNLINVAANKEIQNIRKRIN